MTLYVIAELVARKDQEDALRALLTPFALQSRREPGCLSYDLFEDKAVPGRFMTMEVWSDEAALDAHFKTPHIQAALPLLGPMLGKPFTQTILGRLTT
jgi:quinol monooxygenase YgiN